MSLLLLFIHNFGSWFILNNALLITFFKYEEKFHSIIMMFFFFILSANFVVWCIQINALLIIFFWKLLRKYFTIWYCFMFFGKNLFDFFLFQFIHNFGSCLIATNALLIISLKLWRIYYILLCFWWTLSISILSQVW